jgi:hypothetical protein
MNGKGFHMTVIDQPLSLSSLCLSFLLVVWVIFFKKTYFCQFSTQNIHDIFNMLTLEVFIRSITK